MSYQVKILEAETNRILEQYSGIGLKMALSE